MIEILLAVTFLILCFNNPSQVVSFDSTPRFGHTTFNRTKKEKYGMSFSNRRDELADHHQPNIRENNAPPPRDVLDNDPAQERGIADHLIANARQVERLNFDEHEENFNQANAENRAQIVNMHPNIAPAPPHVHI